MWAWLALCMYWTSRLSACTSAITSACWVRLSICYLGNTVIVVEHDEDAIRAADHVIDIGPGGAGVHGGEVVAEGPLEAIMAVPANR